MLCHLTPDSPDDVTTGLNLIGHSQQVREPEMLEVVEPLVAYLPSFIHHSRALQASGASALSRLVCFTHFTKHSNFTAIKRAGFTPINRLVLLK